MTFVLQAKFSYPLVFKKPLILSFELKQPLLSEVFRGYGMEHRLVRDCITVDLYMTVLSFIRLQLY